MFLGILWVLVTGARWEDIDKRAYASRQTCQRYFAQWVKDGVFEQALLVLARDSDDAGLLDPRESFIDGTLTAPSSGRKKGGRGRVDQSGQGDKGDVLRR